MKRKIAKIGIDARKEVLKGSDYLVDALEVAIGPYGAHLMSGIKGGTPQVSSDAKRIADEMQLEDEFQELGLRHTRDAIHQANDLAGDGRKTCAILTRGMAQDIVKLLPSEKRVSGRKPIKEVVVQVNSESKMIVEELKKRSVPVTSKEQLVEIAAASCQDDGLARLIGDTQWELGKDGTIIVEETPEEKSYIDRVKGVRIDNGFGTSLIVNDVEKQRLDVSNVRVILTNYVLSTYSQIKPLMTSLYQSGVRDVVVVARAFSSDVIKSFMEEHKGGFRVYSVNGPYVNQGQIMKDLAAVLGATYFDSEERDLSDILVTDVGFAEKVVSDRYSSIFTGAQDKNAEERVSKRIVDLEKEYSGELSQFAKQQLEARISQLKNGFAILKVGSLSRGDRNRIKDRAEDATRATKSAFQEGTDIGGGLALKEISDTLPDTCIIKKALSQPYQKIMDNAGGPFEVPETVRDSTKTLRIAVEVAARQALTLANVGIATNYEREPVRYVQEANKPQDEETQ